MNIELYRIDENENLSITKERLLNFDIEEPLDEIDYFLATPVSPNVKKYPYGVEIARAMNESREGNFSYFIENFKNGIVTKYDDEILKNFTCQDKRPPISSRRPRLNQTGERRLHQCKPICFAIGTGSTGLSYRPDLIGINNVKIIL